MIQEELSRPIKNLSEALRNHISLRINYTGLMLSKHIAEYTSNLISLLIMALISSMIILMLSFAFVFWYGTAIGPYHHGFLIISLFYMLLGILIYVNRERIFLNPMIRKMSKKAFADNAGLENKLGPVNSMTDLVHCEEIMKLQIEHNELIIQQRLDQMADAYAPKQLFRTLLSSALTSTTIIARAVTIILKVISDRKEQKRKNAEE